MVAYFLWSFADSVDEVVKRHGGHMVPEWKPTVVSQLLIDSEKNKSFYVVAKAGLKMFHSSCLLDMDFKTRSPSVTEVFGLLVTLTVWDVLQAHNTACSYQSQDLQ